LDLLGKRRSLAGRLGSGLFFSFDVPFQEADRKFRWELKADLLVLVGAWRFDPSGLEGR
jgi:hypothetical protein